MNTPAPFTAALSRNRESTTWRRASVLSCPWGDMPMAPPCKHQRQVR